MAGFSGCVALTGGSGFVGRHVLRRLVDEGYRVRLLARDASRVRSGGAQVTVVAGDLFDEHALGELVRGADAVVHLVGIIMEVRARGQTFERVHHEGTVRLIDAGRAAGVERWVQMSALGTRPGAASAYHRTKWAGERAVRGSGMGFTIFRPSIIHGPDGEFMQMVKGFCCDASPPFMPYFGAGLTGGGGAGRLQPVWVQDVARCFVGCLGDERTVGETYAMGGPDAYTWPELYEVCSRLIPGSRGKQARAIPAWLAMRLSKLPMTPFGPDQVIMSQEDSVCDVGKVQADFGFELAGFEKTLEGYAGQIG